ncbi:hypothetical protein GOBAR_AA19557 [Gossypium barbadense]|uniref:Uncharacterized protein n=1 Tax=Gossypium barbadense TaxID=3634 RepID=A0A2P5XCR2_GOSBA|nr:hypothetical protein GOBAR_AA19557 [Gossypium barbadense]
MEGEGRIHWKRWEVLIGAKVDGGLGFKGLKKFNDAMLAKENLYKKKINVSPLCVLYDNEVESVEHMMLIFEWTRGVWKKGLNVFGIIERIKRAYQKVVGILPFKVGREHYVVGSESVERCSPLDTRWVKVNSDGAVLKNGGKGVMDVIIRNER